MINNLRTPGKWKIHLTITIKFVLSKDSDKRRLLHFKRNNIEIAVNVDTDILLKNLLIRFDISTKWV